VSVTVPPDSTGQVKEIIGIERQIDERKRLEIALKESKEKYKYITENSNDII